jgi:co-chaperonin GroES (HSP10)
VIKPANNQVLLKKHEREDKTTASGIVLSSSIIQDDIAYGTVVAIGNGEVSPYSHKLIEIPGFNGGDKVIFNINNTIEVQDGGETYNLITYKHILATVYDN